jgi:hypothetical protein
MKWGNLDWIGVLQDIVKWWNLVSKVMNFGFQIIRGIFDYVINCKFIKEESPPLSYLVRQV